MPCSKWLKKRTIIYTPPQKKVPKKKKNILAVIWHIFAKSLRRTCTAIGAIILIFSIMVMFSASQVKETSLPEEMILLWQIDGGISELSHERGFASELSFDLSEKPTIHQLINAIDAAAKDRRVKALVADFRASGIGVAHTEELRAAMERYKQSGKPAIFYASDMSGGLGAYYLASIFDEIWMQPVGIMMLSGIGMEEPYAKELLDKIGVSATFFRRKEYKTLYESMTASEMSEPNRRMLTKLIDDLGENILDGISSSREISKEEIKHQIHESVLSGEEALEAGLIDRIDYGDVLVDELKEKLNKDKETGGAIFTDMDYYAGSIKRTAQNDEQVIAHEAPKHTVALIYVTGMIVPDGSSSPSMFESNAASAEDISEALDMAASDPTIKAIVLRVNSPGGSPSASETIRRAAIKAKEKGKLLYVSMGPMAASGGYWISAPADKIFAMPSTITGSIGVVSGKFILEDMWKKLDVNWDGVRWGDDADMWSANKKFSDHGKERMNAMVDYTYNKFLDIVAEGRNMLREEVDKVAGGYVWSGRSAIDAGLVDKLGGLDVALDSMARELGEDDRSELAIRIMPKPKTPAERIMELLSSQAGINKSLETKLGQIWSFAEPMLHEAEKAKTAGNIGAYIPLDAP